MGKSKHLSDVEKFQLFQMVSECGWAEILRALGQNIAHCAESTEQGTRIRSALCKLANEVQEMKSRFD